MSKKRNLSLAACCGVHGLQDGLVSTLYVLLPILAQTFGLNYAQVGIIRAANHSAMMLFEIPSGVLSERFGERSLLSFGLVCGGFGYLWLAFGAGFITILLSLFLAGFGAAFQHALSSSIISNTFRDGGLRLALGVYNSAGDVGKLVFTGLFSLGIGFGIAWEGIAVGFGASAVLGAIILFTALYKINVGGRPRRAAKAGTTKLTGWGIRHRTGFAALALIVLLVSAVQSAFLTFLGFLMIQKQVPTGLAALAVVLTLAGGIFGKFGCGLLAERVGVIRSLLIVQCFTAVFIVGVLLSATLIAFFLLPVLGIVLQGSSSITYGTVSDLVHGDRHSRGFAAVYTISSAASVVGPITIGIIADYYGLAPAMLVMAGVVLLPAPLALLLRPALMESYAG